MQEVQERLTQRFPCVTSDVSHRLPAASSVGLAKGAATSQGTDEVVAANHGSDDAGRGRGAPGCRSHDGFRHEAFLWHGAEEFVAGTTPFIRDGLAAGEPVMAALTPSNIDLL